MQSTNEDYPPSRKASEDRSPSSKTHTQIMKAQGIPDFQAPPPIPKFIDTVEAIDELPAYDSFEPLRFL